MKKIILVLLVLCFCTFVTGCGDYKKINGNIYDTYGIFNETDKKNPDIEYRVIVGNVVWSILLVETIIAPIYFLGFSLFEPVGVLYHNAPIGFISDYK